ncbi:hypothetical protein [Mongoliitalea daihaiensis]|uniref:hypothetical protein n=1 Tax=Mongoliitalea daihaiensis TaxID=2782006 RepID=UPI001F2CE7B3|nr:hypothetical protein [Mongoliitalea daihaiensis]UJP66651.1 hypothetical protein IPZ59_08715 [Mongoliitalea daihaiensis]
MMRRAISVFFAIFILLHLVSCEVEIKGVYQSYEKSIYSWFSSYYKKINESISSSDDGVCILFFDDEKVSDTDKIQILTSVREMPDVVILTNFQDEDKVAIFKDQNSLHNKILDGLADADADFSTPFFFQMKDRSMYKLTILDSKAIKKGKWYSY